MRWSDAVFAIAVAVGILAVALGAGVTAGAIFDSYNQTGQPRAFAAGEVEALTTLRLAVFLAVFQVVIILLTIGAARRFAGTEDLLSLARPKGGALLKVAAVLGLLVFAALVAFLVFNVDRDAFISDISTFSGIMQSGGWWAIPIVAAVGAPLAEEFLFRGYLCGTLKRTPLDRTGAAIISSGMWTA